MGSRLAAAVPGLRLAYVFGSVARGLQGPMSDLDLAILVDGGHPARTNLLERGRLQIELERLLEVRELDLVLLDEAPLQLRYSIVSDGRLLWAADAVQEQRFRLLTIRMYLDLAPLLELHVRRARERVLGPSSDG
ncbi:MAG: nucleotidyltransferase domain-containing protein [Candidatus Wallbacteria bacterium]|nr:nucleotidyltransferase domain-containing protein [Candidatus Wallbacteria bacterium]